MATHVGSIPSFQTGRGFHPRTKLNYAEVREKLRSEYGGAVQSETEIIGALADVDKDLEDCDTEIYRLQTRIIYLKNQRGRMEEYKACLRSLTCPIRKIPNEILFRIFDHTCDMNEVLSRDVTRMPALVLTAVCARWRTLSRSYSILWSRMQIELQTRPPVRMDFPILTLFVERSGQSPLDVEFTGTVPELKDHHRSAMSPLLQLSCRWRRLGIICVHSWFAVQNHLSQLSLIETVVFPRHLIDSDRLGRIQNAPKLRKLVVAGTSIMRLNEQRFPWKQLTSLELGDGYPHGDQDLSEILEWCSNLTQLLLRERGKRSRLGPCVPAKTTHTLEELSLEVCDASPYASVTEIAFSSITSPALTSLHMYAIAGSGDRESAGSIDHEYTRPWPKESLHAFLYRSSCRLTTLCIEFIPVSDADLCELFLLLPSLLDVTIDDADLSPGKSPLTSNFVRNLHAFRGSSISSALVPNLRSLSLTINESDRESEGFDDQELVDMVSSRWLPDPQYASQVEVACLRSVVVHFPNRDVDEEIYRPLDYLDRAGMRVVIIGKDS